MRNRTRSDNQNESGHAFVVTLLVLCLGGVLVPSLLGIAHTGITSEQMYEDKMNEMYAADAGIDDTMVRIRNADPLLTGLDISESATFTLPEQVNNMDVTVTVTNETVLASIVGEKEYADGRPHQDFVSLTGPFGLVESGDGYVVYSGSSTFTYEGSGNRSLDSIGVFFYPYPEGGEAAISDPYDIVATGALSGAFDTIKLRGGKAETKMIPGAFCFIWRWDHNPFKPVFAVPPPDWKQDEGRLDFKFKVEEDDWEPISAFVWTTWKEGDVAFATNCEMEKWRIESAAGSTRAQALVLNMSGTPAMVAYELRRPDA